MKVITLEEHFTSPAYREAIAHLQFGNPGNPHFDAIEKKQADLGAQRIADMDAAGVSVQVLSLSSILLDQVDAPTATAVARDANDLAYAATQAHPDRFAAFAALNLKEPEQAAKELTRCVTDFGFKGAMVNGTTDGQFLDHQRFAPILEAAQALDVPIYLHPAPPPQKVQEAYYQNLPGSYGQMLSIAGWGWHVETGLHALRLIVSGVFDRFPKLQIIIGHMGENLPFSLARADRVLGSNPQPLKKSVAEYFRSHFHVTTSGYFTLPPFLCALAVVGADRLLFSVDYPFSSNQTGVDFLKSLPINEEDREKIAFRNAERLLRL